MVNLRMDTSEFRATVVGMGALMVAIGFRVMLYSHSNITLTPQALTTRCATEHSKLVLSY